MFKSAICIKCLKDISVNDELDKAVCSECGASISSHEAINLLESVCKAISPGQQKAKEYRVVRMPNSYGFKDKGFGYSVPYEDTKTTELINQYANKGWQLISTSSHPLSTTIGISSCEIVLFFERQTYAKFQPEQILQETIDCEKSIQNGSNETFKPTSSNDDIMREHRIGQILVSNDNYNSIIELLNCNEIIKAIKLTRKVTGLGLSESKDFCDKYMKNNNLR